MQLSTIFIFASLALTGLASPNARGTVAQVEADIAAITTQAGALDAATAELSSGISLTQALTIALNIQTNVGTLKSAIDAATADVKAVPTPVAESDAQTVFAAIQPLEADVLDGLNRLIAAKPVLAGLPVPGVSGIVLQHLRDLQASTDGLAMALIASAPDDFKSPSNTIKVNIDNGFAAAIAVYS
ncbi:hydrophobic surface binding protein A-domain-containing protein [Infundibulicybe gibba]|nr:hydrophobic surface binding protein A-domain-containing protein [Infundibulicybe gibba]